MKILVATKRVIDYNVKIRIKPDGSGVDLANLKMSMNPFDEIALEEAVKLKESGLVEEVIAVSFGTMACQDVLRAALARGASRAILVATDIGLQPLTVAKGLAAIAKKEQPDLIMLGKQAIDDDNNQTGQMLAALLNWSQGTFISALRLQPPHVEITREIDAGLQVLKLNLPSVLTADLRLNEPPHLSLPNIMQAKQKPLEVIQATDLGIDLTPHFTVINTTAPPTRAIGVRVNSVDELITRLKAAQVLS